MTECQYAGCDRDATITRVLSENGDKFDFCVSHDPLVADAKAYWSEP